jgi:hypothetical protein
MVAYRAGRVPRYFVDCPAISRRASAAHSTLAKTGTPSSIA